ncbi:hypothetical protein [Angustibacter luteus]|uniref:Uncharacterized protein n=1 Tax=Angustibacter luteus TaxID=658456 RepID=A0ABW1JJV5_9ACTN
MSTDAAAPLPSSLAHVIDDRASRAAAGPVRFPVSPQAQARAYREERDHVLQRIQSVRSVLTGAGAFGTELARDTVRALAENELAVLAEHLSDLLLRSPERVAAGTRTASTPLGFIDDDERDERLAIEMARSVERINRGGAR